jgi:hypothetical protein
VALHASPSSCLSCAGSARFRIRCMAWSAQVSGGGIYRHQLDRVRGRRRRRRPVIKDLLRRLSLDGLWLGERLHDTSPRRTAVSHDPGARTCSRSAPTQWTSRSLRMGSCTEVLIVAEALERMHLYLCCRRGRAPRGGRVRRRRAAGRCLRQRRALLEPSSGGQNKPSQVPSQRRGIRPAMFACAVESDPS